MARKSKSKKAADPVTEEVFEVNEDDNDEICKIYDGVHYEDGFCISAITFDDDQNMIVTEENGVPTGNSITSSDNKSVKSSTGDLPTDNKSTSYAARNISSSKNELSSNMNTLAEESPNDSDSNKVSSLSDNIDFLNNIINTDVQPDASNNITSTSDNDPIVKRTYQYKQSTIRKLTEIKFRHPDFNISMSSIADDAICYYYEHFLCNKNQQE